MQAVQTSETVVNLYHSTRRYNPEDIFRSTGIPLQTLIPHIYSQAVSTFTEWKQCTRNKNISPVHDFLRLFIQRRKKYSYVLKASRHVQKAFRTIPYVSLRNVYVYRH
jgi:hypothetical protein